MVSEDDVSWGKVKEITREIIDKMGELEFEIDSVKPDELISQFSSSQEDALLMNNVGLVENLPKYGTDRDLSENDVRLIVKRCRTSQKAGTSVREFYMNVLLSDESNKFSFETLRSWLKNPRFN
jgi:hypothetical protein